MRHAVAVAVLVLAAGLAWAAEVKITGADRPVTLRELAGTDTLVTVVLKDSGAKDANLKVVSATDTTLTVLTQKQGEIPYLLDTVEEVQVQGGKVEGSRFNPEEVQMLRAEQQRVVDRAFSRAREIYGESSDDQEMKMDAAVLLALSNDGDATNYLKQLVESNDLQTQLEASRGLYLIGESFSESLVRQGLESGNRDARALSASLTGVGGFTDLIPLLKPMFADRAIELSTPAARALARMGQREIISRLVSMVQEPSDVKGEAAVFALARLGGDDVRQEMLNLLSQTEGKVRLRVVMVLHALNDPTKTEELKRIFSDYPTLSPKIALVLAREGDWDATQFLRARLARREDPTDNNLIYRAEIAAALLASGDPTALTVFQDLLRSESMPAKMRVFELVVELGSARIIPLLQPSIENVDKELSHAACQASIALALPAYRARLLEMREEM
ncbi:MAG TPA: hypothetical protein P5069_09415 [Candidatus Hydrogenedentes bacterium]|nr:hypothetical protein [Candidatus Hydrogenedentota bacterium]HOC71466.1 hypothetical protein [Candidatus Hydrogenedentota bacterium]HOH49287.1 hypothetical protein [Candidatus Hydrogenedentota bacterium]HRZ82673.1 hypothetical protein [Candidatus Hydrogenedentota bacterium]